MRARLAEGAGWAAGLSGALVLHLAAAALVLPRVAGLRDGAVQDAVFVDLVPAPPAPGFTPPPLMRLPLLPADAMQPDPPPDFTPPELAQLAPLPPEALLPPPPPASTLPDFIPPDFMPPEFAQLDPLPAEALVPPPPPDFIPPPLTALPPLDSFPAPSALALAVSERPASRPQRRRAASAKAAPKTPRKTRTAAPTATAQARPKAQEGQAAPKHSASNHAGTPGQSRRGKGRAAPSRGQIAKWQAQVQSRITRHMQRTRLTGRASVRVSLTISVAGNGRVSARLENSTGNARMDRAIARQAARLPRLPAPPGGRPRNLVLPIRIN